MLTPKLYNLAKKKNQAVAKVKRQNLKSNPPAAPQSKKRKTTKTTKTPKDTIYSGLKKPKKKSGFKSKKKHKRRK